jgi:hypothetical protein
MIYYENDWNTEACDLTMSKRFNYSIVVSHRPDDGNNLYFHINLLAGQRVGILGVRMADFAFEILNRRT